MALPESLVGISDGAERLKFCVSPCGFADGEKSWLTTINDSPAQIVEACQCPRLRYVRMRSSFANHHAARSRLRPCACFIRSFGRTDRAIYRIETSRRYSVNDMPALADANKPMALTARGQHRQHRAAGDFAMTVCFLRCRSCRQRLVTVCRIVRGGLRTSGRSCRRWIINEDGLRVDVDRDAGRMQ